MQTYRCPRVLIQYGREIPGVYRGFGKVHQSINTLDERTKPLEGVPLKGISGMVKNIKVLRRRSDEATHN